MEQEMWTPKEIALAAIWRDVLQIDSIARDDNFFDIGGDSLGLLRILERLPELTTRRPTIDVMFAYQTVAELAAFLDSDDAGDDAPDQP